MIQRFSRSVWPVWGLFLCLFCGGVASADNITSSTNTSTDDTNDLPPAGLTGWFFTSNNPPPYPVETDPGEPWTSPENIATLDYWLNLVVETDGDPALLQELYGLGMISAPDAAAVATAETVVSQTLMSDQQTDGQTPGAVPEPPVLMLLGGSFVLLALFAAARHRLVWRDGSL